MLRVMKTTDDKNAAILDIVNGPVSRAQRVGIYGPEGVGKTTLASQFPTPVFIDMEDGTHHLDAARFPKPDSWSSVEMIIRHLIQAQHSYRTVIIDTADWLEKILIADICQKHNKQSIEEFGYGKGYVILGEAFAQFLALLDQLRGRGIHVVMVAHSQIRKFEQPDANGSYDRYELKLSKSTAPLLKEWVDMLLFANYETRIVETDGKKRAIGRRERVIYATHTAAWDAKNRHGFEDKLKFGFEPIASAFKAKPNSKPAVKSTPDRKALSAKPESITQQQIENINTLWERLKYSRAEMTKLFAWLGVDAIEGDENWNDLSVEQAAKVIGFLSKKLSAKEAA